jgi:hypothetical protein
MRAAVAVNFFALRHVEGHRRDSDIAFHPVTEVHRPAIDHRGDDFIRELTTHRGQRLSRCRTLGHRTLASILIGKDNRRGHLRNDGHSLFLLHPQDSVGIPAKTGTFLGARPFPQKKGFLHRGRPFID